MDKFFGDTILAPVSSERTRLEPPTPRPRTPGKTPRSERKKHRNSMPTAASNPPDPNGTPRTPTAKRRKSHSHAQQSHFHAHSHSVVDSARRRTGQTHAQHPPSSPAIGHAPTSPLVGDTPLPLGNLSALATTALALANAHPSERDAIVDQVEARRADKARKREEKRKRREARAAAEVAAAERIKEDWGSDREGVTASGRKKKRKHSVSAGTGTTPSGSASLAVPAITYSLPPPATPSRGALPVTPTPKRVRVRDGPATPAPSMLRTAVLKPETPYTGPSRSAADVSMAALLASGKKRRAVDDDETARKAARHERHGDSSSSMLFTPHRPGTSGGDERRSKKKDKKKEKKHRDRTVENTMTLDALLATPGAISLPPSTPGHDLDDDDEHEHDLAGMTDEEQRAAKERRRAEKAERKARRKAEKAEKERESKEKEEKALKEKEEEMLKAAAAAAANVPTPDRPRRTPQRESKKSKAAVESDSDDDSSDDDVNPADILRGRVSRPEPDHSAILRGRARASAPSPAVPKTVPASAAAAAASTSTSAAAPAPTAPATQPKAKATKAKAAIKPKMPLAPATTVSTATAVRAGRKKAEGPSQAEADSQLRTELADEAVMNEFLASKWIEIKELQRLEAAGVLRYKRGRFSEEERSALREWLDTFRKANRLSEDELLEIIMAKGKAGERSQYPKFYSDLAGQVPGRPVRYVKEAVKRMYDPRARKGAWTKKEDEELLKAYEMYPNEWIKIAAIVDRSESDCRDRWRGELKGQESRVSGAWSTKETDALIDAVTEANRRLGLAVTAPDTPWQVVVDLMGGRRSLTQCRKKWQDTILPDLKAKEAREHGVRITKTSVSRRDLLDRLRALNVTHERDLSWTRVVPPEWDVKPGTLRGVWHRMKHGVPGWGDMPFTELLDKIEESL